MTQTPAPQINADPAKKTTARSSTRSSRAKTTCKHSIFYYETDKRRHMLCCQCGRRRWIKIDKGGVATVGRWVVPRKKKEEHHDNPKASDA